jgi:hypothetical protein
VPGLILAAAVTPDNTPGGYVLTFAFPVGLFALIGVVLSLLLFRPHRRIPARRIIASAQVGLPDQGTARGAAVAGGLSTAAGGGSAESHLEPAGAARTHLEPAEAARLAEVAGTADSQAGSVAAQDDSPQDGDPGGEASAAEGSEASE